MQVRNARRRDECNSAFRDCIKSIALKNKVQTETERMHTISRRLGGRQILWLLCDFLRPHVTPRRLQEQHRLSGYDGFCFEPESGRNRQDIQMAKSFLRTRRHRIARNRRCAPRATRCSGRDRSVCRRRARISRIARPVGEQLELHGAQV